jgi:hypothetical protein
MRQMPSNAVDANKSVMATLGSFSSTHDNEKLSSRERPDIARRRLAVLMNL